MSELKLDISGEDQSSKYIVNEIIRVCSGRLIEILNYNTETLLKNITSEVFHAKSYYPREDPKDQHFKELKSLFIGMISEKVRKFLDSEEGRKMISKKTEELIEYQVSNLFKYTIDKKDLVNQILEKLINNQQ